MRIDLHTHSSASDGTTPPAELMRQAREAGLDVVALTDHDNTVGWRVAAEALPRGLTLVPGAELSCDWTPPGGERPIGIHLLAYLFDPADPTLAAALETVRASRTTRGERIVEMLRADGYDIGWEEVLANAAGAPVGRPHVAKALLIRGLVPDMAGAFTPEWLGSRYRVSKANIEIFEAVRMVRAAGGVPVFAHPLAAKRGRVVPDELLVELAAAGLAGLEADHVDHDDDQRAHVRRLAAEAGMFVTGSSDFHGENKPVRLGENATTTPEVYEVLVAQAFGCEPLVS